MGEPPGMEEDAFFVFELMLRPNLLSEDTKKKCPPNAFERFNSIPKGEFLELFSMGWNQGRFRERTFKGAAKIMRQRLRNRARAT
jgi:hypothetical protein